MKTILLSGAHGVGKGFFLNKIRDDIKQYEVYSASKLIERYQLSTDSGYKKVSNVNNNQDVLITALKEAKFQSAKDVILDGHLCLFNANGEVERIPENFFINAQINRIVLLQDDSNIICDRINQRDAKKISVTSIEKIQEEERKYVEELHRKIQMRYKIISHECTGREFEEFLKEMEE